MIFELVRLVGIAGIGLVVIPAHAEKLCPPVRESSDPKSAPKVELSALSARSIPKDVLLDAQEAVSLAYSGTATLVDARSSIDASKSWIPAASHIPPGMLGGIMSGDGSLAIIVGDGTDLGNS